MRFERILHDGHGRKTLVIVEIDESGTRLEKAIARLANKAQANKSGHVAALDGAVRVSVTAYPKKDFV